MSRTTTASTGSVNVKISFTKSKIKYAFVLGHKDTGESSVFLEQKVTYEIMNGPTETKLSSMCTIYGNSGKLYNFLLLINRNFYLCVFAI